MHLKCILSIGVFWLSIAEWVHRDRHLCLINKFFQRGGDVFHPLAHTKTQTHAHTTTPAVSANSAQFYEPTNRPTHKHSTHNNTIHEHTTYRAPHIMHCCLHICMSPFSGHKSVPHIFITSGHNSRATMWWQRLEIIFNRIYASSFSPRGKCIEFVGLG